MSIAIVGGGIGGLTTAIALSRQGVTDFKVYERAPSIRNLSQGILAISSNGQWALDQVWIGIYIPRYPSPLLSSRLLPSSRLSSSGFASFPVWALCDWLADGFGHT